MHLTVGLLLLRPAYSALCVAVMRSRVQHVLAGRLLRVVKILLAAVRSQRALCAFLLDDEAESSPSRSSGAGAGGAGGATGAGAGAALATPTCDTADKSRIM